MPTLTLILSLMERKSCLGFRKAFYLSAMIFEEIVWLSGWGRSFRLFVQRLRRHVAFICGNRFADAV